MLGVIVNFATVIVGGTAGTLLKGGIPEKYRTLMQQGVALCVMMIGISGALETENMMLMIASVAIGAVIGTLIGIETGVEKLGQWAEDKFSKGGFTEGFVNATLLYSIGSMTVVGSMNAGFGNSETLLAKAALDFCTALIIGSAYGIGAAFATVPMTIYQGTIAMLAGVVKPYMSDEMILEMSAIGSVMTLALGLNMLGVTKIKVANLLPAMFVPCVYYPVITLLGI